jgi:hypothetical protein
VRVGVAPSETDHLNQNVVSAASRWRIWSGQAKGQHGITVSGIAFLGWTRSPG